MLVCVCEQLGAEDEYAQILEPADEEIVLAVEMRVGRGAADVGAIDDLLHGECPEPRSSAAACLGACGERFANFSNKSCDSQCLPDWLNR